MTNTPMTTIAHWLAATVPQLYLHLQPLHSDILMFYMYADIASSALVLFLQCCLR